MSLTPPAIEFSLTLRIPSSWPLAYRVAAALHGAFHAMRQWPIRRRNRQVLTRLDDRMLQDIGVSRDAVARECAKPFWRA